MSGSAVRRHNVVDNANSNCLRLSRLFLNTKIDLLVPVDSDGVLRADGFLRADPSTKVLIRFSGPNIGALDLDGLWPAAGGGYYYYLPSTGQWERFELKRETTLGGGSEVDISIERWSGDGEVELYSEIFKDLPKLVVLADGPDRVVLGDFVSEVHSLESWVASSNLSETVDSVKGPFAALLIDLRTSVRKGDGGFSPELMERFLSRLSYLVMPRRVFILGGEAISTEPAITHIPTTVVSDDSWNLSRYIATELYKTSLVNLMDEGDGVTPIQQGLWAIDHTGVFHFPAALPEFELIFSCYAGQEIQHKDALVSFKLVDQEGDQTPIPEGTTGFGFSSNPEIGLYRYLNLEGGYSSNRLRVALSRGVRCSGVEFQRFGSNDVVIMVGNVHLEDKNR